MTDAWRAPSFLAASSIDDSVGKYAVGVFADRGWRWGGDWRTPKDYQHFER
jgi:D-alanyl-D-alanine carboxypeptidase